MKFNLSLESIKYVKITYKDKEENPCHIKASVKQINEREIIACAKLEEEVFIKTPQEVELDFISETGLYQASADLKYIERKEEFYLFFILKTPTEVDFQQNREYFRVKKEDKAILKYDNKIITCKIHDISANGVRLTIPEDIGEIEEVFIDMLFQNKNIKTPAKYVRTDEEDGILKYSFTFVDISQADQDAIAQICIQTQLENKRNSIK